MNESSEPENAALRAELTECLDRCRDLVLHYKAVMGVPANDVGSAPDNDARNPPDQAKG